ncbi:MAG: DNA repair protein RecN, partial [Bacteroidales bacterium]|nr:DNA repair protein RecN [Bacteroidales bacterium]
SILIDIHSQHQTLMLGKNQFQLSIIDSFANHKNLLLSYSLTYREFREKEKEYSALSEGYDKAQADFEYYNHQLKQLDEINLIAGEEVELEKERDLLLHSEEVNEALSTASLALNGDEAAAIPVLGELKRRLDKIVEYLPESKGYVERLDSVAIELNDLANELERKSGVIDSDPARLNILSERLDLLFTLMQKHRSESVVSLIEERESIRGIVDKISLSDERMTVLKRELNKLDEVLLETGRQISDNRAEIAPVVETKMSELLAALGMPNARFVIKIHKLDDIGPDGFDHADFMFTSNKQVPPENLNKVASGGELSRVMLSLKSLLSDKMGLPTIFFDEIDAGVSGEVATRVGEILSKMGREMQVINITHLPQVAAHAEMHYFVFKEDNADSTITHIKLLDKNERLNEVARLLSGNEITGASLDNARNLINGI